MNRADLVSQLAAAMEISVKEAEPIVDALFASDGIVASALKRGDPLEIPDFGVLFVDPAKKLVSDFLGTVRETANDRITIDPRQCGGRPRIRGMRIRVVDILDLLAA